MPFQKGNGGRPKGCRNKDNRTVEETAERLGVNIFEVLCRYAMGDWKGLGYLSEVNVSEKGEGDGKAVFMSYTITPETRLRAAESAAKYLYTPKRAVDPNEQKKPLTESEEQEVQKWMDEFQKAKEIK